MADLSDTFTDTSGVLVKDHTADSGHTWATHPNAGDDFVITPAGRCRMSSAPGSPANWVYSSYVPPTADYRFAVDLVCVTAIDTLPGVCLRCDLAADTAIFCRWNGTGNLWLIQERIAGVGVTTLGSAAGTLTAGQTKRLMGGVVGTTVTLYVDGVATVTGTTAITDAGRPALRQITNGVNDDSNGIHMDNAAVSFPTSLLCHRRQSRWPRASR